MKIYLDNTKKYYKANLHCHSTNSDGKATPEKIKEEYIKRGYSVVAYTEHEHIASNMHLTDENFIAITGFEMGIGDDKPWNPHTRQFVKVTHLNFYALDPNNDTTICTSPKNDKWGSQEPRDTLKYDGCGHMRQYSPEGISAIIKYAHEHGFLVCYNHPVWSNELDGEYLSYDGIDFVEIFNTGCDTHGLGSDEHTFDIMLKQGKHVACIAADDNHNSRGFDAVNCDSFGGWVMINADKLTYADIMDALRAHRFYASCGPEIYSLVREGNVVSVKTSPAKRISKQTDGRQGAMVIAERGEYITEASFEVKENEKFFRITVEDEHGKRAYTQAYETYDN